MDLKSLVAVAIQVLTAVGTFTTAPIINTLLGMLKALQDSPQLLDWLASLLAKVTTVPGGALPEIDPSDAELASAYNNSPAMREWAANVDVPAGAEAFAVGSVITFLQFLPQLIALLKALKTS